MAGSRLTWEAWTDPFGDSIVLGMVNPALNGNSCELMNRKKAVGFFLAKETLGNWEGEIGKELGEGHCFGSQIAMGLRLPAPQLQNLGQDAPLISFSSLRFLSCKTRKEISS